eukprot:340549-Pelagomonas_calceolata.AAC.1
MTFLQMAHPVVESHRELERLRGLPSKPCFTRLPRSVSLVGGSAVCCSSLKELWVSLTRGTSGR